MTPAQSARHSPTVDTLIRAGRNPRVVRYAPAGSAAPLAVAGHTYDALPATAPDTVPTDGALSTALGAALCAALCDRDRLTESWTRRAGHRNA
jgi:hypothetical protein